MNALRRQRGFSLIELMVGQAIGLLIVAAGLFALTHHLKESRQLLAETRLMQDLRTTTDLIARDLRRAGRLDSSGAGVQFVHASAGASAETFSYRLRSGVIEMQFEGGNWQAMTDANTMQVSALSITPRSQEIVLHDFCARACDANSRTCPPRQTLRSLAIRLEARASVDSTVLRSLQTDVRLRNDAISGACPT